ncbi:MAG: toxin-antitoxin system [Gammaproteobacteria bacterium]|nr:toxin-antitoxin system [Gammaproteobacteria bacterium]NNJ83662.1 toxin-antitoxin system [Gammaproteobacteria bacterium]
MTQMLIRNLDHDIKEGIKARAALHGWSMEQEAREILRSAIVKKRPQEMGLGSWIASRFADIGLEEDLPEIRGQFIEPVDFTE